MTGPSRLRPTWAEIDLGAISHNARWLRQLIAPAELCAVVKAWAYGHGPVQVAEAALAGGATRLAVALVEEGRLLRSAGVTEPIILLSEPPPSAFPELVALGLTPTLYTLEAVDVAAKVVADGRVRGRVPLPVHVKVDTGMHRVGAPIERAGEIARAVAGHRELHLEGLYTHFAVADEPERDDFTAGQLRQFLTLVDELAADGITADILHAANSAGAIAHPDSRLDMVRCGIAVYGHAPSLEIAGASAGLRPALSLKTRVLYAKEVAAGEAISYGLRYTVAEQTTVATVPIGYADGVPRRLSQTGGCVLIGGERRPIAGSVTMDQLMIDCGPGASVNIGDEVVLIGRQGDEEITAWDWAQRCGTIAYEVLCGVSGRVPRTFVR
jgi:alanine racemase